MQVEKKNNRLIFQDDVKKVPEGRIWRPYQWNQFPPASRVYDKPPPPIQLNMSRRFGSSTVDAKQMAESLFQHVAPNEKKAKGLPIKLSAFDEWSTTNWNFQWQDPDGRSDDEQKTAVQANQSFVVVIHPCYHQNPHELPEEWEEFQTGQNLSFAIICCFIVSKEFPHGHVQYFGNNSSTFCPIQPLNDIWKLLIRASEIYCFDKKIMETVWRASSPEDDDQDTNDYNEVDQPTFYDDPLIPLESDPSFEHSMRTMDAKPPGDIKDWTEVCVPSIVIDEKGVEHSVNDTTDIISDAEAEQMGCYKLTKSKRWVSPITKTRKDGYRFDDELFPIRLKTNGFLSDLKCWNQVSLANFFVWNANRVSQHARNRLTPAIEKILKMDEKTHKQFPSPSQYHKWVQSKQWEDIQKALLWETLFLADCCQTFYGKSGLGTIRYYNFSRKNWYDRSIDVLQMSFRSTKNDRVERPLPVPKLLNGRPFVKVQQEDDPNFFSNPSETQPVNISMIEERPDS